MNKVSSFTVIVTFVCLALVGLALIPLLPVKLNPSRNLPGFTVGFSMPGASSRVVEMGGNQQTGIYAGTYTRGEESELYFG